MAADDWPWPGETVLERARRIANNLLALLPDDERDEAVAKAHAVGETWLGGDLVRWQVDDIVTTAQAAGLVYVKASTIRKWHSDGDLPNANDRQGRYRVGDVLDCAALKRARRVAAMVA